MRGAVVRLIARKLHVGTRFWIKRFLVTAGAAFALLMAVELLKGHDVVAAVTFSAIWSVLAAGIFVAARLYHSRRGRACALCNDTPQPR
jgi:hypothetical protein